MNIRGAEALMHCLVEENVDTIFGYPGGAIMPVYDALYDFKDKVNHKVKELLQSFLTLCSNSVL